MYVAKDSRLRRAIRYSAGVFLTLLTLLLCPSGKAQSSPPPVITSIQPMTGVTNGGTLVTITGSNFQAGATVSFGASPAQATTVVNGSTITTITPSAFIGAVDVTVTDPDTQTATLASGFTYAIQGTYVWTTIAGLAAQGSLNGTNSGAHFIYPEAVTQDAAGNIYLANNGDHTIRKLTLQGTNWVSSTIAGTPGRPGFTDGTNGSILFRDPRGLVVDSQSNIFVADGLGDTIRELSPQGDDWVSRTIAGVPGKGFPIADGTNQGIILSFPSSITMDSQGNLFVGESSTVRELMPQGTNWVSELVGSSFSIPTGLAVDAQENLYVADTGHGTIEQWRQSGTNWVYSIIAGQTLGRGTADGTNGSATFMSPDGIAIDANTNIYISDGAANTIRLLTPMGTNWVSSTIAGTANLAGSDDGTNNSALFYHPIQLCLGNHGDILVADLFNSTIRDVTPSGTNWITTTLAGQPGSLGTADGTNSGIRLNAPEGLSLDHLGNLLIADESGSIRRLTPTGTNWSSTTILDQNCIDGNVSGGQTYAIAFHTPSGVVANSAGDLFVTDAFWDIARRLTLQPDGSYISTLVAGSTSPASTQPPPTYLASPQGLAIDNAANIYVADTLDDAIVKYAAPNYYGAGTTLAGPLLGSTNGSGNKIAFHTPTATAVDAATNIYITDAGNNTIRKLVVSNSTWFSSTIAGTVGVSGSADGTNNNILFSNPYSIAVDVQTNLYVADAANNTIRKLTPVGTNWVSITIGGYAGVYGAVDGTNTFSSFANPQGVAVDTNGNIYVSDTLNNTIRVGTYVPGIKINATITWANPLSMIYGVPLSAAQLDATVDVPGTLIYNPPIGTVLNPGTNTLSVIFTPTDLVNYAVLTNTVSVVTIPYAPIVTLAGTNAAIYGSNLTLSASVSGPGPLVLQWQLNGTNLNNTVISTFAGNGTTTFTNGNLATNTGIGRPAGLTRGASGNCYMSDSLGENIYKIDGNGIATKIAGKGFTGSSSGDGGPATNASLQSPAGLAVDTAGNLYIADFNGLRVRKVDVNGIITTFAGKGTASAFSGDGGAATSAQISNPEDVAVDSNGNVFIADSGHGCVRKVDVNGIITTVAGTGTNQTFSGDGGAATNAGLNTPKGIAFDAAGNLYIADTSHGTIRKVDVNGIITSVAGTGATGSSAGDGGPATNATFAGPAAVKIDSVGNIYIVDSMQSRIRKVDTNGIVTAVAGNGSASFSGDGGLATNAVLSSPDALVLDAANNLFVADFQNFRLREIYVSPTLTVTNASLTNAGKYQLTVTSPYGATTVGQTVAVGLAPLQFTLPISNQVTFQFTGKPVTKYILQSATNLTPPTVWTPVITNTSNPSGAWSATATNKSPNLYYRVSTP